ncbi:MAG: PLP-dependent aminotransferase family protein [Lachnospiraceae bacterium]|nr:PLP-dependent aminotransferase family protein [Lachnospiraceae bacterium]
MLIVTLDGSSKRPLYEQIYEHIKSEIKAGRLSIHQKLPSTRSLSNHLAVSRSTVDLAYNQLLSEGYIESVPKSGYYVAGTLTLLDIKEKKNIPMENKSEQNGDVRYDFSPFTVDISSFPFSTWRKLSSQCMNDMNQGIFLLGENQGDYELREAISRYLHDSRGVNCEPAQIVIGAGADYLLQLLAQLLNKKQRIAIENPTYMRAYHILKGMGFDISPIEMEKDGIDIGKLTESEAEVVYVTPSHQYPLGIVMPIKKRLKLLEWAAAKEDRYIIEDDHDSEFRYIGKPIPSLQGIDVNDRVIYMGTFSRAIAPAIRVGYMVLPESLLRRYREEFYYYASTVSRIDQSIISKFIEGGYFERHLNKMRTRYKAKHDVMIKALKIFDGKIRISGENAGLHLVVEFLEEESEEAVIKKAAENGIRLYGLTPHCIGKNLFKHPVILLGYSNLSEEDIISGVRELYENMYNNYKLIL